MSDQDINEAMEGDRAGLGLGYCVSKSSLIRPPVPPMNKVVTNAFNICFICSGLAPKPDPHTSLTAS